MIVKGQIVRIKKEWLDAGDNFTYVAVSEVEKGRLDIMPIDTKLQYPPINTVSVEMLEND